MKLKQSRTNSQPGEALKDEDNRSKQTKPTKTGLQIEKQAGRWSGNPGWWGGGGRAGTLVLTWLCRPSGIRAEGVGARGSQGWLPALYSLGRLTWS